MGYRLIVNSLQMTCPFTLSFMMSSFFAPNSDLAKISEWALQCKMSFNSNTTNPAHEVIFSRKLNSFSSTNNIS